MSEANWIALEWVSAVLGACYTFLAAFEKRIGWIFAIVSSVLFVVYYLHRNYTGQMVLNGYYVAMGFYGWFSWGKDASPIPVTRGSWRLHVVLLTAALLCTAGLAWLFDRYGWSESPWMDAWVGMFSVLATWMMARKMIECWAYWCLVDGVAITMFLAARPPMYAYTLLYIAYVILSIVGFRQWQRTLRGRPTGTPSADQEGARP